MWTRDDMPSLEGKNVVVTGANSGLGRAATKAFANHGAHVVMACRSEERARTARDEIQETVGDASLSIQHIDLASLDSIEAFAEDFHERHDELHVLCNNAGVMAVPRQETEDGFEMQFGVNHLGHYALTAHLLPVLQETDGETRVVTHSSEAHRQGRMHWDDLQLEHAYDRWEAYAQSKLANLLFTYELDRRADVTSVACHPGLTKTNLFPDETTFSLAVMHVVANIVGQSPLQGVLPLLYAATAEGINGGEYVGPDGFKHMWGNPEVQESSQASHNRDAARRLWKRSEELTDVTFS